MGNYIEKDVLRGKIAATKLLVNKQLKVLKETEDEISKLDKEKVKTGDTEALEKFTRMVIGFQMAVENTLNFIARNFDEGIKGDEDACKALIEQMTREGENRPAVIDNHTAEKLLEYLGFRLKYSEKSHGDPNELLPLLENLKAVSSAVRQQMNDFFDDVKAFNEIEE